MIQDDVVEAFKKLIEQWEDLASRDLGSTLPIYANLLIKEAEIFRKYYSIALMGLTYETKVYEYDNKMYTFPKPL